MNKQLDEILDFCFEGEVSWIEDQLVGTSYYKETMEGIDKRKAEAKVKLQKLIIEAKIEQSYRCRDLIEANADREEDEEQKAVSENEKIREMLNDPEVIGKAAKGAIKAQRKMAGLESEEN